MNNKDIRKLYDNDSDFKRYVDECRKNNRHTVDEEIELITIQEVAKYYQERRK
jgi:hypothetical protein